MTMTSTTAGTAQRASDAMKDLVAVTEHLEQSPSDATWASGSLLAVTSRLAKTLHQLAEAHRASTAAAHTGPASGPRPASSTPAIRMCSRIFG